jgi:hypothetical protein
LDTAFLDTAFLDTAFLDTALAIDVIVVIHIIRKWTVAAVLWH